MCTLNSPAMWIMADIHEKAVISTMGLKVYVSRQSQMKSVCIARQGWLSVSATVLEGLLSVRQKSKATK